MPKHEMEPAVPRRAGLVAVDGRTYPLESVRLEGRAEGGIAYTTVKQSFRNPYDESLEVFYTLPLPADGPVLGYTIRIGEKTIHGEIQPRDKAAEAYREALYEGRTAGLLEQDRADAFFQKLGNVPPRTRIEVAIDVMQPLSFLLGVDGGGPQWEYRFPTVVSVRYEGAPGRVSDAERLDVDRGAEGSIPTRFELDLEIAGLSDDDQVTSPSHELVLDRKSETRLVRLGEACRLDRDLVLRWAACRPEFGVRCVEGRGLPGDDGRYALLTVVPPGSPGAALHRDLTVLIDASGSMGGEPIELARRVVLDLLSSLEQQDRFEVIAFASSPRRLTPGLVAANPKNLAAACDAVGRLQADGGTEMLSAVQEALRSLRRDAQRQIVLVTDGQIGFEQEVIERIAGETVSGVRVHAVGIGAAPNRTLLRGVAAAGRGVELSAGDARGAQEAAKRLREATVRPVLTDVRVRGTAVRDVAPERPRDVCAGQPLVMAVELVPSGGELVVSGRIPGSADAWTWSTAVPATDSAESRTMTSMPIGALFGRAAVEELELGRTHRGMDRDQLVQTCALRHRIVSRLTSLVAIAEEPSVDPLAPRRRETLAVELPAGLSAEPVGLFEPRYALSDLTSTMQVMPEMAMGPRAASESRLAGWFRKSVWRQMDPIRRPLRATVIRVAGDILILEVEIPGDGVQPPVDDVAILIDGVEKIGTFVAEASSSLEVALPGTLVRMAFQLQGGVSWPAAGWLVLLQWETPGKKKGDPPVCWYMVADLSSAGAGSAQ